MTPLQARVLDEVRDFVAAVGESQTIQMIADRLDVSKGQAYRASEALVSWGLLRRVPGLAQGLRLADEPNLRGVSSETLGAELARRGVTLASLNPRAPRAYGRHTASCAATCCGASVQRGHLFCREHWFVLPAGLRERILRSFGRRDVPGYQAAVAEARDVIDGAGSWGDREQAA